MSTSNYNPVANANASQNGVDNSNPNSALHGCCTSSCTEVGPKYGVFIGGAPPQIIDL